MATILIDEKTKAHQELFKSKHWIVTPLPGESRFLVVLTGIVCLRGDPDTEPWDIVRGYKGITSDAWRHDDFVLNVGVPFGAFPIPPGNSFRVQSWAPFISLNAIFNQDEAVNAGWAVDEFGIILPQDKKIRETVGMSAKLAVRDSDGYLYRVGYHLTLTGQVVDEPTSGP